MILIPIQLQIKKIKKMKKTGGGANSESRSPWAVLALSFGGILWHAMAARPPSLCLGHAYPLTPRLVGPNLPPDLGATSFPVVKVPFNPQP